jgi:hypothetical protein
VSEYSEFFVADMKIVEKVPLREVWDKGILFPALRRL